MKHDRPFTAEERQFYEGFTLIHGSPRAAALALARRIRAFMPGLPAQMQDELHNAAYALEQWADTPDEISK